MKSAFYANCWIGACTTPVWDWVVQNKTWLFSGAGITALGIMWWAAKRIGAFRNKPAALSSPSSQPQVNINVSPTISPTLNQSNTQTTSPSDGTKHPATQPAPDIKALTYKAAFAQGIGTGKSCFIMSFRNDGWADATNVIAHIGYSSMSSSQKFLVDYGGWIEHMPVMDIGRGHTKNLIFGVTEAGKNFAVTDIGPATNYARFELVEVGEITPGDWKMIVTLSADNFRRDYVFDLTVGQDGSFCAIPRARLNCKSNG